MTKFLLTSVQILPLILLGNLGGCALMSGMEERSAVCSYDHAWDAAVDVVKDRSINTKDKDSGLIVTHWLEIPMPGRTYGIFRREVADSRDRSRLTLEVKRRDDVTKISFIEERESWAFRGGARLFGWVRTEPSDSVMRDVQNRIDAKLKEHGCTVS
ncbi:MAG: hypothetical protein H8K07_11610 [Nitrospira sp.]|nr:hypothetical protein [Nitrospira sp.]